jgi:riboflavin biosynthesis pyrimidine reductase
MRTSLLSSADPFVTLFDETPFDKTPSSNVLPDELRRFYDSDLAFPTHDDRPHTFSNFVISRDGRISFNQPAHMGGGDVSDFNAYDQWLMGLLRARADAVIVGDMTLRVEPDHLWTSTFICPSDADAFAAARASAGLEPTPLQVFLSLEGDLNPDAAVWQHPELRVIVATTARGRARAKQISSRARIAFPEVGEDTVNLALLMRVLRHDYGVHTLLCEGGPRAYGSLMAAGLIDEEFLTLSPVVIGQDTSRSRPGLIEGVAFTPVTAPRSRPLSLKRAGDYLFLRSRLEHR